MLQVYTMDMNYIVYMYPRVSGQCSHAVPKI